MIDRVLSSIRRHGIRKTVNIAIRYIWHNIIAARYLWDRLFDLRYGTDTHAPLEVSKFGVPGDNLWHAAPYHPTHAAAFVSLMKQLNLSRTFGFVDLGCGKGRVLLLAARYGFGVIRGVEFSSVLYEIARNNVELYTRFVPAASVISVHLADVTEYEMRPDENVYFIFNAFDDTIMNKLMMRFRQSLEMHPRPLHLIYNNPLHYRILETSGLFQSHHEYAFPNDRVIVYSSLANATN